MNMRRKILGAMAASSLGFFFTLLSASPAAASSLNQVSEIDFSVDPTTIGESAEYTINFTLSDDVSSSDTFTIVFYIEGDEELDGTLTGINLENASASSESFLLDNFAPLSVGAFSIDFGEATTAGEYSIVLSDVLNPEEAHTVYISGSTNFDEGYAESSSAVVFSEALQKPQQGSMHVDWKKPKKVKLDWRNADGADAYRVQVRKCKNVEEDKCDRPKNFQKRTNYRKITDIDQSKKVVKNLEPGTYYQWRVRSCNNTECTSFTDWKRFRTKHAIPNKPPKQSSLSEENITATTADLTWAARSLARTQRVQVRECMHSTPESCATSADFEDRTEWDRYLSISGTSKRLSELMPGTYYQWRVRSCTPRGCSSFSQWQLFTTAAE